MSSAVQVFPAVHACQEAQQTRSRVPHSELNAPAALQSRLGLAVRVLFVATPLFLGACSTTGTPGARAGGTNADATADTSEVLPIATLDRKTLYQLMLAEIASQRGLTGPAYATELQLAADTRDPRIARRATEFALQAHDPKAAIAAAQLWVETSPKSLEATETLTTVLALAGRFSDAEPLMRTLIKNATSKSAVFGEIEGILSRCPDHAGAYALMQRLLVDYPAVPEAHLALAQLAQLAGDHPRAVAEARVTAALKPDWDVPAILAAQYQIADAPTEAEKDLTVFLKNNPNSATVHLAYARLLIGAHRYDDASVQFEILLKLKPNDPDTLYTLALLAYQAEKPQQSEQYFKSYIVARERHPAAEDTNETTSDVAAAEQNGRTINAAYLYLAQIAEDRKDTAQSLKYLDEITDGDEFLNARIKHALIVAHQGQLDAARGELHKLDGHTEQDRVQITLAEAQMLRDADQNQMALEVIDASLAKTPDEPDLLYDKGMTAEKLNQIDVMESAMRSVIQISPDNAQAYNALGYTFADRNIRLAEARELIEKALTLAPEDASIIDSLGWVEYRQGELTKSIENLRRAYELRADPDIAVHLGEVLWVSGEHTEAEKFWREAGRKEPDNLVLRQTLARFKVSIGAR